ncbi:predicted protein [Plenodomus lingam JN3]|uniref:Predicted protein n=1 Tax=Leptosphaeria maculans (strain JN3 / isolate v23.1.3 / race Av1-4-5-6-7-8) TaxID=985895 RepID=E4ZR60_LEPMJ|nr:predicted protein [Plenodomus lingam JN3]CBX93725.1 predicted protein [Plenodomus lingam JN3]
MMFVVLSHNFPFAIFRPPYSHTPAWKHVDTSAGFRIQQSQRQQHEQWQIYTSRPRLPSLLPHTVPSLQGVNHPSPSDPRHPIAHDPQPSQPYTSTPPPFQKIAPERWTPKTVLY